MKKSILFTLIMLLSSISAVAQNEIVQGSQWLDTTGKPINAHGGGILYHDAKYYWYGVYKKGETILPEWATWECYRTDVTGISCYSSPDMVNWTFEGIVLPAVKDDPNHDLHPSKVLERPKVVYNKKTGKFVMWAHVESADYSKAAAGVAAMFDRWNKTDLENSRYVWLPLDFSNGKITIPWREKWSPADFSDK